MRRPRAGIFGTYDLSERLIERQGDALRTLSPLRVRLFLSKTVRPRAGIFGTYALRGKSDVLCRGRARPSFFVTAVPAGIFGTYNLSVFFETKVYFRRLSFSLGKGCCLDLLRG